MLCSNWPAKFLNRFFRVDIVQHLQAGGLGLDAINAMSCRNSIWANYLEMLKWGIFLSLFWNGVCTNCKLDVQKAQ